MKCESNGVAIIFGANGWFFFGQEDCGYEVCVGIMFMTRWNGSYGSWDDPSVRGSFASFIREWLVVVVVVKSCPEVVGVG